VVDQADPEILDDQDPSLEIGVLLEQVLFDDNSLCTKRPPL